MAKIRPDYEAVRYLAGKALYDKDELCKSIMQVATFKKRGIGFKTILTDPYVRDNNSTRVVNIISEMISKSAGDGWYLFVARTEGLEFILKSIIGIKGELVISPDDIPDDEQALNLMKIYEWSVSNKKNTEV